MMHYNPVLSIKSQFRYMQIAITGTQKNMENPVNYHLKCMGHQKPSEMQKILKAKPYKDLRNYHVKNA